MTPRAFGASLTPPVSQRTVYRWLRTGLISATRTGGGRRIQIDPAEALRLSKEYKPTPVPPPPPEPTVEDRLKKVDELLKKGKPAKEEE